MRSCLPLLAMLLSGPLLGAADTQLVDAIDPLSGTDSTPAYSHGNTNPAALLPFPLTCWAAQTAEDGGWFYQYGKTTIQGIRSSHQPSVWIGDYGCITLMPTVGAVEVEADKRASPFDHRRESAKPWRYAVAFDRYGTTAEVAPTVRCAIFRFTYPASAEAHLLVDDGPGGGGTISIDRDARRITGVTRSYKRDYPMHFVMEFDRPLNALGTWTGREQHAGASSADGGDKTRIGAILGFATAAGGMVTVRIGTSFIDGEQAARNLALELPGWDLDAVAAQGRAAWSRELQRFGVEGGSSAQRAVFATAVYRALSYPHTRNEPGDGGAMRHRSPFDSGKVHDGACYTDNGFWDTFRAQYPLIMTFWPERGADIIRGLVNAYAESGWMPIWPGPGHLACMIGTHADAVVADAVAKGITGFDRDTAYAAMRKDGDEITSWWLAGRRGLKEYLHYGYIPADLRIGAETARTLEYAYDDWCIAQVAGALGRSDDAARFLQRARSYAKVFDPATGFMRGRNQDGSWQEPFDPLAWGDPYIEGSAWQYTWSVQHDPYGLMALYGGRAAFAAKLDAMMASPSEFHLGSYKATIHEMREFADARQGQYAHTNEPVHHVLYLWLFAGQPWKTQYWVRDTMDRLYLPGPGGLCGDEDTGQMSAWFVWNAIGLYPFCPGQPSYVIGSPLFPRMSVAVAAGRTFTVEARGNSPLNRYIQAATLNGKPFTRTWISHQELVGGGTLTLEMGPQPNEHWGSGEADGPPRCLPPAAP